MKSFDHLYGNRCSYHWINLAAAGLLAAALAGCGGGGGGDTTATAPPAGAAAAAPAAPAVAVPTGTAPVTLTAATPAATFAALTPAVPEVVVTIASPPKVTFSLTDGNGNAIIGFGSTSKSSTATVASYPNISFALAKYVAGTSVTGTTTKTPGKWVSYIVTSVPSTTTAATAQRPGTDNAGTLVDNKNGTYTYTFYRDITKVKDEVAAMTLTAPNVASDLGDLTFEPTLPHRLTMQISGNAPGTGTNTPTGVQVTTGVPMTNPVNVIYDFIPSTGKAIAAADLTREVVAIANCNECHEKLALHGGGRTDTRYCVVCHTDQRKFGRTNVASTAGAFPALVEKTVVNSTTGITSYLYSKNTTTTSSSYHPTGTDDTYVADGEVAGNFPTMVHKIHQGKELVKQNYNYANVAFNNKGFSMLGGGQKMCAKCHDNTKAVNADNWNTVPSRLACGACHDGIKWSDGTGTTLAGATTGHVGKAQSSDVTCALCHAAADIKTYHYTENVTPHNPTVAVGLANFTYDVKSAAVDATSNDVTIVFRISKSVDGGTSTPVTFLAPATPMANPLSGFTGAPSFLLAYASDATATDGIAIPVDYNNAPVKQAQALSVSLASLLDTANATTIGSLSATPDSNGYYTATLKGAGSNKCASNTVKCVFPVGAKMRAVALQGYFTQVSPAAARHAISVFKTVTGDTARRTVVDKEKCANCHEWFEGHGGNRVKETQVCVMCHVPGLASSGRGATSAQLKPGTYAWTAADKKLLTDWGIDPTTFGAGTNDALKYPVVTNDFKDLIHGIHAGRERVTPFKDARNRSGTQTLLDFRRMDFPGVLNNCETCHVAGTYSNAPIGALASTYESIDAAYAAGIAAGTATAAQANTALNTVNSTDKVTSPFAAACVSCHDSAAAQGHIATQGGMIMVDRSVFKSNVATAGKGEACGTCHGAGKAEDPAVVHKK